MSNALYPLGLIQRQTVVKLNRVLGDEFESGATSARLMWTAQYFKRRIELQHSPLTLAEFRYLRSFWSQRSGRYDSFWFRDNAQRGGNVSVRFASDIPEQYAGRAFSVGVSLQEVAAIRALPEFDELAAAAGFTPLAWFDANRERYMPHAGAVTTDASAYDASLNADAAWQAGTLPLGNYAAQYQHYAFTGSEWARTAGNVSGLTGAQPACTVFAIVKHGTVSSKQVLFSVGAMGAGKAIGIAVSAANFYEPWIGGSEAWGTAKFENSAINTWRSVAVVWAASSDTASLYVNGASALTESETRAFEAGPLALGAAIDGTLKASGNVAHALVFAGALSQAQVKAVHNLLGYQYGLATV